ncbi:MAG: DNA primase [Rhizonema sp. PD38]|nr:DNA primase [Rhizonema sp. PD38]
MPHSNQEKQASAQTASNSAPSTSPIVPGNVTESPTGGINLSDCLNKDSFDTFNIRNFADRLTPAKEKGKYICPVCGGHNLSIKEQTGEYQCFNGCECRDIREAIAPWEEKRRSKPNPQRVLPKCGRKPAPEPVLLPSGELAIARLPEIPLDIPTPAKPQFTPTERVKEALLKKGVKEEDLKEITVTTYDYSDEKKTHRYQAPADNPKGYEKTFAISRTDSSGKILWNKGKDSWAAYRQEEAIAALLAVPEDKIPVLLIHEGEKCVEALRAEKIAGITTMGSSSLDDLAFNLDQIKSQMGDRVFILAHCQDNDKTGIEKAQKWAKACVQSSVPFVAIDLKAIKPDLCEKGDIVDVLAGRMGGEELVELLLEQIKYVRLDESGRAFQDNEDEVKEPVVVRNFNQIAFEALYGDKPWICANEKLYCREENYYEYIPEALEIKRIRDFCNNYPVANENKISFPYANPTSVSQILSWVKMSLKIDARLLNPPGLNCTNGVLQLHWQGDKPSWKLEEHSPKFYYTYRPIATYDPEADPQHCDRLLEALDPPQREIFLRTIAASLDLKTVRQYKGRAVRALLLKGDGSNGKDSLREVVSLLLGKQGMTNCTLTDFAAYDEGRKFSLAKLIFSMINWSSENANSTRLDKIQSLKAFITGDPLDSERKGVDGEEYEPHGIAIFNINEIPTMQGAMEAILSRYGILEFSKTFKVGADRSKGELEADPRFKYDPMFMQALVVPAFLNRVLQALVDLMVEGIDYSCTKEALEGIQAENSHLFQFCQETGLIYDPNNTVAASEIWSKLEGWYLDNGILTYDGSKALWAEQVRPSDKNIKAAHQVVPRFLQLFPKAKRVMIPRPGGGKPIAAIAGIAFVPPPLPTTPPTDEVHIPEEEEMKPLGFTFKEGDRIRCYPTKNHSENLRSVEAQVVSLETDNGYFKGCTVEYRDWKKGSLRVQIAGGNVDWILGKVS